MKIVFGFGVNDADYSVNSLVNGRKVTCQSYNTWASMLRRCYSKKNNEVQPTYIGVSVCNEWRSFMKFREWWIDNHVDGWQIDKDILTDSKVYSPETCIYVPGWLNKFILRSGSGLQSTGVCFHKVVGKYQANCRNPISNKKEFIGYFVSMRDAHDAWVSRKLSIAKSLKSDMDSIDERIYERVVSIITK